MGTVVVNVKVMMAKSSWNSSGKSKNDDEVMKGGARKPLVDASKG